MPSCVRSTLGARAPQWEWGCRRWDARPPQCRGSRQWCAGVGRPPILPPFPWENVSRCFWSLDYLPLEYCLMMTVNVMASNRHLRWWSPPVWFVGEQTVGLPLIRRAGRRLAQRQWCVLDLSFPGRPGRCQHRSKALSYPGRRRTSKTVALQLHEFESRCDSTLPYASPVLGMATAVWNLPAPAPDGLVTWCTREVTRGVYEMTAKLCQLQSAGDVATEAGLIGIDRWMLRRSYCVCVWRLTCVCGRVSTAERHVEYR